MRQNKQEIYSMSHNNSQMSMLYFSSLQAVKFLWGITNLKSIKALMKLDSKWNPVCIKNTNNSSVKQSYCDSFHFDYYLILLEVPGIARDYKWFGMHHYLLLSLEESFKVVICYSYSYVNKIILLYWFNNQIIYIEKYSLCCINSLMSC